jgi:hypothetical protein
VIDYLFLVDFSVDVPIVFMRPFAGVQAPLDQKIASDFDQACRRVKPPL